jgi:hypothetical protein
MIEIFKIITEVGKSVGDWWLGNSLAEPGRLLSSNLASVNILTCGLSHMSLQLLKLQHANVLFKLN